jgi:hypothetical protein
MTAGVPSGIDRAWQKVHHRRRPQPPDRRRILTKRGPVYGRNGIRHIGGLISGEAAIRNMGTFGADANGEATSGMNQEGKSTNTAPRGGTPRSSGEAGESRGSQGGVCSEATSVGPTRKGRSLKDGAKPFCICRWEVWEAYLKVKSVVGAQGVFCREPIDDTRLFMPPSPSLPT